jgi:two-component system, OmpR family, copper resistance phosphate regulon response regulator CusR
MALLEIPDYLSTLKESDNKMEKLLNVLVVEDEPKTARAIKKGLEENKMEVTLAYDGLSGKKLALQQAFDVIILDIILPQMGGVEVCKELRAANKKTPILLLTALGTTEDKVIGLDSGADDYLVKPFEFKELLARIKSLTRRSANDWKEFAHLQYKDLILDLNTKTARRGGKTIELTAREFTLLEYLIRNKERIVSKAEISENVWNHYNTNSNIVEVYMNYLRNKIDRDFEPKLIHTSIGMGYILKEAS